MSIKNNIDRFNYLLTTTAGHGLVLFAMIAVQLFSTTTFFSLMMHEGKKWIADDMPEEFSYGIGFLFALSLEFGIYFAAVNGRRITSNWFAFISAVLALISFQGLLYDSNQTINFWIEKDIIIKQGEEVANYVFNWYLTGKLVAVLIISIYPAVFIADVSHKLYDIYKKEGFDFHQNTELKGKSRKKRTSKKEKDVVEAEVVDDISNRIDSLMN